MFTNRHNKRGLGSMSDRPRACPDLLPHHCGVSVVVSAGVVTAILE